MRGMIAVLLAGVLSIGTGSTAVLAAKGQAAEGRGIEQIKDRLAKLNLSDEQTKKIGEILDDARQKVQALLADAKQSGDRAAAREKAKPIIREATQKIAAELTPEQKAQFRAALKERRSLRRGEATSEPATTQPEK